MTFLIILLIIIAIIGLKTFLSLSFGLLGCIVKGIGIIVGIVLFFWFFGYLIFNVIFEL